MGSCLCALLYCCARLVLRDAGAINRRRRQRWCMKHARYSPATTRESCSFLYTGKISHRKSCKVVQGSRYSCLLYCMFFFIIYFEPVGVVGISVTGGTFEA